MSAFTHRWRALKPFRITVPFRGQTTQIISSLSPRRGCSRGRGKLLPGIFLPIRRRIQTDNKKRRKRSCERRFCLSSDPRVLRVLVRACVGVRVRVRASVCACARGCASCVNFSKLIAFSSCQVGGSLPERAWRLAYFWCSVCDWLCRPCRPETPAELFRWYH